MFYFIVHISTEKLVLKMFEDVRSLINELDRHFIKFKRKTDKKRLFPEKRYKIRAKIIKQQDNAQCEKPLKKWTFRICILPRPFIG